MAMEHGKDYGIQSEVAHESRVGSLPGWLRKSVGWGLMIAGVAGCILPILPGFPLIIAGLILLGRDYLWARKILHRARRWAVHLRRKARRRRAGDSPARAKEPSGV